MKLSHGCQELAGDSAQSSYNPLVLTGNLFPPGTRASGISKNFLSSAEEEDNDTRREGDKCDQTVTHNFKQSTEIVAAVTIDFKSGARSVAPAFLIYYFTCVTVTSDIECSGRTINRNDVMMSHR